jgi:hypothetical protein
MAGRGEVSWLPGIGEPRLPGGSVSPPVADATCVRGFLCPVTVAGPRRHRTGLPFTTGLFTRPSLSRPPDSGRWPPPDAAGPPLPDLADSFKTGFTER